VRPRFPDQFAYLTLNVEDNEEQNLFPAYASMPLAKAFIDTAIAQGGGVLVHCNGTLVLSCSRVV
ncbi:hypothetical protein C8R43DRAFT_861513, partial [Mycena crocata]